MDFLMNSFMNFLELISFSYLDFNLGTETLSGFIKNIFLCVSKINQSFVVIEEDE